MAAIAAISGSDDAQAPVPDTTTNGAPDTVVAETFSYYAFLDEGINRTQAHIDATLRGL